MTITLERLVGPACDSKLANYIEHLIDNLAKNLVDIVYDYQEVLCCKVILINNQKNYGQIEIHNSSYIELLYQQYFSTGGLKDINFSKIIALPQFTTLIGGTND